MTAARILRSARRGAGLSQRTLSARVGLAQSAIADVERGAHDTGVGTLERLVAGCGGRLFVLPTSRSSAAEWADHINRMLRNTEADAQAFRALMGLSDDLVASPPDVRVALCIAPPAPTGDPRFGAAIAALVEHLLGTAGLPVPEWVGEADRILTVPWTVSPYAAASEVAPAFRRHGVLLAASELESV